jgi:hypothetical protein
VIDKTADNRILEKDIWLLQDENFHFAAVF